MPLHVAFQGAPVGIAQRRGEFHDPGIKSAAGHADIRAHVHDALAPHPAYAQDRDSGTARAELRRGIVGRAQMEGIGSECAVRPRDFGRDVPRYYLSILVLLPVLNGGMVHRHIDAAYAYALCMGFQRIGFLCVNSDGFSSRDVSGDNIIRIVLRVVQRNSHIAVIFHTGESGGDIHRGDAHIEDIGFVLALIQCVDGDIPFRAFDGAARDIDVRGALVDDAGIADAHADANSSGARFHFDLGAISLLRLPGFDGDILARDIGSVHGHVGVIVRMDDVICDSGGDTAAHRDLQIFLKNVVGVRRLHIDISRSRQSFPADLGMDALLPGIGRTLFICGRGKAYAHFLGLFEVALGLGVQTEERSRA